MMLSDSLPIPFIRLRETDSTSNYLSELSRTTEVEEYTVVIAHYQTSGKGQRGNSWESEPGKNLLFSFILYPTFLEIRRQFLLSQIVALSIKETLDTFSDGFTIKWPNDIYWKDQKICGTLLENDLMGGVLKRSIAGIGINTNQREFHSSAPNPVSLWQITGKEHHSMPLLNDIMKRLICYYALLKEGKADEISRQYHRSLFRKEGMHRYRDASGEFLARIVRVEPEGFLVLADEQGNERKYAFKEVQYVR